MGIRYLFMFFVGLTAVVGAAPPSAEQMDQAIKQLGDDRYEVRERATMFLWNAGPVAEPYLRQAMQSTDAEVIARARDLLDKIPFGITPDSPKSYVALVARARAATPAAWDGIVAELLSESGDGLDVAMTLADKQPDPKRRAEFRRGIDKQGWRIASRYIAAGNIDKAEELLSRSADAGTNPTNDFALLPRHYATFLRIRGNLSARRPNWDKLAEGRDGVDGLLDDGTPDGKASKTVAAYLAKAAGDFPRARQLADQIGPTAWLEMTRFDAGVWKDVIDIVPPDRANMVPLVGGLKMIYARLSGDAETALRFRREFDATLTEAKLNESDAWLAFRAIMFDGRPDDALKWIEDMPNSMIKVTRAEILAQRGRISDALKLLANLPSNRDEQFTFHVAKARILAVIGDRQLLVEQLGRMKRDRYDESAEQLSAADFVEQLVTLQLHDAALEHAAALLAGNYSVTDTFAKLYPRASTAAESWWSYWRMTIPDESALATLKRIPPLLDQRLTEPKNRELFDKAVAWAKSRSHPEHEKYLRGFAEAIHLAGASDVGFALLAQIAEANPPAVHLKRGDMLADMGQWREAALAYEQSWKADPKSALPVWLASLAREQSREKEAADKLRLIARLLPLGDEAQRLTFCEELAKRADLGDAVRDELRFQRRLIVDLSYPSSNSARNALSLLCQDGGNFPDRQSAADANQKFLIRMLRTNAYFKRNEGYLIVLHRLKAEQARDALKRDDIIATLRLAREAHDILPPSYTLATDLVPELVKRNLTNEADTVYRSVAGTLDELAKEYPQSAALLGNRAWLAARCRRDLDRALELAKQAVQIAPDTSAHRETLSEVYLQKGDRANAKTALQPALAKQPRSLYLQKLMRRVESGDRDSPLPER